MLNIMLVLLSEIQCKVSVHHKLIVIIIGVLRVIIGEFVYHAVLEPDIKYGVIKEGRLSMVSNLIVWCMRAIIVLLIIIAIGTFIPTKSKDKKDSSEDE